jgi:hypothetical protein
MNMVNGSLRLTDGVIWLTIPTRLVNAAFTLPAIGGRQDQNGPKFDLCKMASLHKMGFLHKMALLHDLGLAAKWPRSIKSVAGKMASLHKMASLDDLAKWPRSIKMASLDDLGREAAERSNQGTQSVPSRSRSRASAGCPQRAPWFWNNHAAKSRI